MGHVASSWIGESQHPVWVGGRGLTHKATTLTLMETLNWEALGGHLRADLGQPMATLGLVGKPAPRDPSWLQ